MTESRRPYGAPQPESIDDDEDRMGSMAELHFDEDESSDRIAELSPESERQRDPPPKRGHEAGMSGATTLDHESTDDDLSIETMIREDGARDGNEAGESDPADWDLSIVDEDDIGGGNGLDEAEMAERDPVNGNR
ncbi:serine kinase/phosphatase [Pseudomonas sp. H11T01]|uniref:serine kinase/phosphatase n=1 Tax=Pseudomonas sp. H11T01 TaxID=3402749 RepID=UPI003AC8F070